MRSEYKAYRTSRFSQARGRFSQARGRFSQARGRFSQAPPGRGGKGVGLEALAPPPLPRLTRRTQRAHDYPSGAKRRNRPGAARPCRNKRRVGIQRVETAVSTLWTRILR